jgi:hypothetical protein
MRSRPRQGLQRKSFLFSALQQSFTNSAGDKKIGAESLVLAFVFPGKQAPK